MKTGFREHLAGGALLSLAFAYFLLSEYGYALFEAALASLIFLASSLLPDIDSPVSKPRRYARILVLGAGLVVVLYFYSLLASPIAFALPFLALMLVEQLVPGHRGFLHSPTAAVLWGSAVGVGVVWSGSGSDYALLFGSAAALGYATHLLIDFFGDRL